MTERIRPERRPLVPRWLVPTVIVLVVALVALAAYLIWSNATDRVEVPDVVGLDAGVATTRLAQAGLEGAIVERRFGAASEDTVLEQDPAPGTEVAGDTVIKLVVSAGSEEFQMPDVVGLSLRVAQAQLEESGLTVKIDYMESEQPRDMVLATNPAPGATVRTADIVRLTVASEDDTSTATLPYGMSGVSVVLDPSGEDSATAGSTLEIARRLQSLLEASGAKVTVTRSLTATDTSEAARAARAAEASATAVIGLDITLTGQGGMGIVTLAAAANPSAFAASTSLAEELAAQLSSAGTAVARTIAPRDAVLEAGRTVGARVRLGSASDQEDAAAFRDPSWSDSVARGIYRALGERFGTR